MKKKITFKHILKNLDAVITGTTLVACVIIVNLNVIMRYMLSSPLQWSEEIVTSLFVWTVFFSSAAPTLTASMPTSALTSSLTCCMARQKENAHVHRQHP